MIENHGVPHDDIHEMGIQQRGIIHKAESFFKLLVFPDIFDFFFIFFFVLYLSIYLFLQTGSNSMSMHLRKHA